MRRRKKKKSNIIGPLEGSHVPVPAFLSFLVESSSDCFQSEAERGKHLHCAYVWSHTLTHVHILQISEDKCKGPVAKEIIWLSEDCMLGPLNKTCMSLVKKETSWFVNSFDFCIILPADRQRAHTLKQTSHTMFLYLFISWVLSPAGGSLSFGHVYGLIHQVWTFYCSLKCNANWQNMHIAVTDKTLFSVSAEKSVQTLNIFICNMGTTFNFFFIHFVLFACLYRAVTCMWEYFCVCFCHGRLIQTLASWVTVSKEDVGQNWSTSWC